jgi:hypothetical protein
LHGQRIDWRRARYHRSTNLDPDRHPGDTQPEYEYEYEYEHEHEHEHEHQ